MQSFPIKPTIPSYSLRTAIGVVISPSNNKRKEKEIDDSAILQESELPRYDTQTML
jgi:hypothetical protein